MTLKELIKDNREEDEVSNQREEEYKKKIIESYFEYNKLKSLPVQKKKRKIVLEKIAESFERNRIYTEKEVNLIIADFYDDFCTVRRDLVGFNLMERKDGKYRRI